ncbi:MAG: amidase [Chloroflexota bacterium]
MELTELTLQQVNQALAKGESHPLELTQAVLERIQHLNPRLNCYLDVFVESALKEARRKQQSAGVQSRKGPLWGVPMGLKDLFAVKGLPLRAGSRVWEGYVPEEDAFVVKKLRRAGVIVVGHHNMHEIALGVTNVNPHFGACRNPWNQERISGGSSGGSAVAVASGLCFGALGTDTGGSIRIPASLCGVVGLKPTYGRVSVRGVLPLSWNLDHVGPLARCVEDARLIYQVIAGYDRHDPFAIPARQKNTAERYRRGVKGMRIALAVDGFFRQADEEVLSAVQKAGKLLGELGAIVEEVDFPNGLLAAQTNAQMVISDAAAVYEKELKEKPQAFGEDVFQRLQNGAALTSAQYIQARKTQTVLRKQFSDFFRHFDVLITPATPVTAPLIDGKDALEQARILTRFTAPFNLTGLPAMSLPCGFSREGLPIGLQIVAKPWDEESLFQAGYAYEQAAGWWMKRPLL